MTVAAARMLAATLTAVWVLAIVLLWLLLPRALEISGGLLVVWYAALWIPAALIAVIPFGVASVFPTSTKSYR